MLMFEKFIVVKSLFVRNAGYLSKILRNTVYTIVKIFFTYIVLTVIVRNAALLKKLCPVTQLFYDSWHVSSN